MLTKELNSPHLGSIALAVLYLFFAVGSFFALPAIKLIGSKYALFVGAFTCVVFLAGVVLQSHLDTHDIGITIILLVINSSQSTYRAFSFRNDSQYNFMSAFIKPTVATVVLASAINGYGASLLWVTQVPI